MNTPSRSTTSAARGSLHSTVVTLNDTLQSQVSQLTEQLERARAETKSQQKDSHSAKKHKFILMSL